MNRFDWEPYGDYLHNSRIRKFMDKYGIKSWQDLIKFSTENTKWFWGEALSHLGVEWFKPYHAICDDSLGMPWTKWFLGGKINITHNCLDRHILDGKGEKISLFYETEDGACQQLTYQELYDKVCCAALAMKNSGVKKGDGIALCMPICTEAVVIMFAAMKIGAVCMQISTATSIEEIINSLQLGKVKMFFTVDGYMRGGERFETVRLVEEVLKKLPDTLVVVKQRFVSQFPVHWANISHNENFRFWGFIYWSGLLPAGNASKNISTSKLDSEHHALILFSSGTTGKSKAVIHTHGGALAQIVKEVGYAFDCRDSDVFFWLTNIGWMMAPWEIIGTLFFGGTVLLYEGAPFHPTPHRLFELIEKYKVTILGTTPTALRLLAKVKTDFSKHDLSSLRILGSTGEPLDPETWRWYFETFGGSKLPIMNIIGGTEIIGCHLSPLPVMPQKAGTVGGPGLGMNVDVVDEDCKPLRGEGGYLVCKSPFPSMTRGFLGNKKLFLETYFDKWPNVWLHGDRAEIDEDGLWFMLGRADDLIVRSGIKHDPSKIEAALISFSGSPKVKEAAAIGATDPIKGQKIVCFVAVADGGYKYAKDVFLSDLRRHVVEKYDSRSKPDEIYIVSVLPKNTAAKIPRSLLRKAYEKKPLGDVSKIDHPQALEEVAKISIEVELQ